MKISEVDAKVIEAIQGAKRRLMEATGRGSNCVAVELENSFYAVLSWSALVFYDGGENISHRGDDLEEVVADLLARHASRDEKKARDLRRLRTLAEELGLTIKEVA